MASCVLKYRDKLHVITYDMFNCTEIVNAMPNNKCKGAECKHAASIKLQTFTQQFSRQLPVHKTLRATNLFGMPESFYASLAVVL